MKRNRVIFGTLVVVLILAGTSAFAGATLDRIVERGEIRIGMTGNQPPLSMTSKSGELIGFEVDLANLLAQAMEVKPKLVTKPFPELIPALLAGEIDVIISGMTITPQRNTKVAFVGPYNVSGKSILTKSSTLATADETEDINTENLTLTALKGSTSERFVKLLMPKAKLTTTDDYDAAVKMVLEDQANALVADIEVCQFSLLRYPDAGLATLAAPLTIEPIGIALPPNDPLLMNLIQNYLGTLEGLELLDELRAKWYEDGSWLIQIP